MGKGTMKRALGGDTAPNTPKRRRSGRRARAPGPVLGYQDGIPLVPVTVERGRDRGRPYIGLHIAACPHCGWPHMHGAGTEDLRGFAEHRVSHCMSPWSGNRGYILFVTEQQEERSAADHTSRMPRMKQPQSGDDRH